jgi:hypothetical protein
LQLVTVKYSTNALEDLMLNHDSSPICIGMSKYYNEFVERTLRHEKFAYHYSIDISSLECCFSQDIHTLNAKYMSRLCHNYGYNRDMLFLAMEATKRWVAVHEDGRGVLVEGAEPSGGALTIWVNSIYVCAAIFVALLEHGMTPTMLLNFGACYMLDVMGDDVRLSLDFPLNLHRFTNSLYSLGLFPKYECVSRNLLDHSFLSMFLVRTERGYEIRSTRPEKLMNALHKGGYDPKKTYDIAVSLRNELYTHEAEFGLLDRFCFYLENTFSLPNKRTSGVRLDVMYGFD